MEQQVLLDAVNGGFPVSAAHPLQINDPNVQASILSDATPFPGADITLIKTQTDLILPGNKIITKISSSPLTTGTLFNITGRVQILSLTGKVTTVIQAQATTIKLSWRADALAVEDLCTTLDINGFLVGSLLGLTGAYGDAMQGVTGKASKPPMTPVVMVVVTTGIITVTFGAASTGAIVWDLLWIPLSTTGSVVAV